MLDNYHNPWLDTDEMLDEQPQETGYDAPLDHTPIQTSATGNSSSHPPRVLNTGFACSSCASTLHKDSGSNEAGPAICNLVALACILALFTFDKDEAVRDEAVPPDQYLAGKGFFQALSTVTEAMKGQCQQPIVDLLNTPLFNSSLDLSNQYPLTTELSLEEAVSSAFRRPASEVEGAGSTQGYPVAVLIAKSDVRTEPSAHRNTAVTIAMHLRGPHLGRFALVRSKTNEGSLDGHLCIYFFNELTDLATKLAGEAGGAYTLYTLAPHGSDGATSIGVMKGSAVSSLPRGGHTPEAQSNTIEQESSAPESDSGPTRFAHPQEVAPEDAGGAPAEQSLGDDSKAPIQTSGDVQRGRAESPPPPYNHEGTTTNDRSPAQTVPDPPPPSSDSLDGEAKPRPARESTSRETKSYRQSANSDFGWMQALQSAGPIVHPLSRPRASQEIDITPKPATKEIEITPPFVHTGIQVITTTAASKSLKRFKAHCVLVQKGQT
ncbi:hypothetical protein FA13DRAFT_1080208 [Coprinellus micaceus]|uniref:Uncharacterized protein n=1 Tax=Coprinellus micaceus TaxID=71717 RepID=A0A4Y7TRA6_COPMI|nr:hypothetical protein FA13DRAFT_1080208 [Coprinellus micaceus]